MPPADRVLVFGDLIDDVIVVPQGPIRPDTDTPSDIRSRPGGSAANTAAWLAQTGAEVTFVGRCAQMDAARHAALLEASGVHPRLIGDDRLPTGTIIVVVEGDVRSMLTERGANAALSPADVDATVGLDAVTLVHATGYSLIGHTEAFAALVDACTPREGGYRSTPAPSPPSTRSGRTAFLAATAGVDILIATTAEAAALTGEAEPDAAATALAPRHAVVAVTAGRDGAWVGSRAGVALVEAVRVDAVDPTGAGDAFTAGLLAGLLSGDVPATAAGRGVELAARAVTVVGGRPPALSGSLSERSESKRACLCIAADDDEIDPARKNCGMSSIAVLVGNPQPNSRTRLVAEEVARQLAARGGAEVQPTIELSDVAEQLFPVPAPEIDVLLESVATADVVVVASPTYKATYTGLLKAFLDRYGNGGLARVTAVPVLTIGAPVHALAVEVALRPLLVELGASVPTRGIAFPAGAIDERERIVGEWLEAEWPRIGGALR